MKQRLNAADYRFIAICAVLLGATVWFSAGNFYRAFPEASIDFKVNPLLLAGDVNQLKPFRDIVNSKLNSPTDRRAERLSGGNLAL